AREAMWQRFIPASVVDSVDVAQLVERTEGFSPADIEFAARSASQRALEKAVYDDGAAAGSASDGTNARKGPVTQDYLDAIADTRTTVSPEVHQDFLEDIDVLGRV
ncbi:AAA family ATPase, partial [Paenarthrobacter nicotinovorans]